MEQQSARRSILSTRPLIRRIFTGVVFVLLLAFLYACAAQRTNPVPQSTHTDIPRILTVGATFPAVTASPMPDWEVRCDPTPQIADANYAMPLRVFFGRWNGSFPFTPEPGYTYYEGLMLMGFDGKATSKIVDERTPHYLNVASPDGKWLAYIVAGETNNTHSFSLLIADTSGKDVRIILNEDAPIPEKWLSDNRILLSRGAKYMTLDIETLKQTPLLFPPPGRVNYFNDQGTHAVLFNDVHISVYDLSTGKSLLISNLIAGGRRNFATWSPDGSYFAVFANFSLGDHTVPPRELSGLYVVDAKGIYEQINSYYGETPFWSPNERFIAFRYSTPPNIPDFTVLYDMVNKKEIRFCDGYTFSDDHVVWSPDERYMVARSPLQNGRNWAIIEVETGKTVIIPDTRYTKIYSIANAP